MNDAVHRSSGAPSPLARRASMPPRPDLHARLVSIVAHAIAKGDRAEREQLAALALMGH